MTSHPPYPPPPFPQPTCSGRSKPTPTQVQLQLNGTCIPALRSPIECDNNNIFRLELCRNALDHNIFQVLDYLPWLRSWVGFRPIWLLPATVIFKIAKANWEAEFRHEIKEYKELISRQGRPLPIYYGIGSVDGTEGMVMSYCGTTLNEQQDLEVDKLRTMLKEALTLLAASGRLHKNLNLSNILFDGQLWIIDLEQTSCNTDELDIEAEVSNILSKYRFRQEQIQKFSL